MFSKMRKETGIRFFTGILAVSLLLLTTASCEKDKYTKEDLLGTWAYDANTQYTVTFKTDGTMGYTAPESSPAYTPTFTLDGIYIYIRVVVGSATVSDVVEIRSLSDTKLIIYYDGDLLFDGQSLNGEYSLTKK